MNHLKSDIEKLKFISKENTPEAIIAYSRLQNHGPLRTSCLSRSVIVWKCFLHNIIPFLINLFKGPDEKLDPDFGT